MSPLDLAKKHPLGIGVAVVVLLGIGLLVFSGGGSADATASNGTSSDGQVDAGLQLQAVQQQYAAQANQTAAQKDVALATLASNETIAKLQYQSSDTQAAIAASVAGQQIGAQEHISSLDLANQGASIAANQAVQLATINSLTEQTRLNNQTLVSVTKENNKPKGLFSFLFG